MKLFYKFVTKLPSLLINVVLQTLSRQTRCQAVTSFQRLHPPVRPSQQHGPEASGQDPGEPGAHLPGGVMGQRGAADRALLAEECQGAPWCLFLVAWLVWVRLINHVMTILCLI